MERAGVAVAYQVTVYNSLGEVAQTSVPRFIGDPAYWSIYTYDDPLHRLTQVNTPTADGPRITDYAYPSGFKTQVTEEANGAVTTTTRDALGEVTKVSDAAYNPTTYTYGPFGELTRVSGPDDTVTTIHYDSAGHRTQLTAPDPGTVNLVVDSLGEVTQRRQNGAGTRNYRYDGLGRLTYEDHAGNPDDSYTWHYAHGGGNAAGQLYEEDSGDGSFTRLLSYDPDGELTQDKETWNGASLWFNYDYDSLGRMTKITYPVTAAATRLKLTYAYDGSGALASVTDANDGTVYWQQTPNAPLAVQNAWGEMQAWTLGSGTEVARGHTGATGAVSTIQAGPNGDATVVDLSYGYDALGNVHATDDAIDDVSRTLGYDKLNRYTDETITNPNAPGGLDRGTGYGAGGNINWRTLVGSYNYGENGAPPHAVTTITHQGDLSHYAYDAAGRMTSGGALSAIDWNWSGQVHHLGGTPNVYLNYTPDGDLLTKGVDGEGTARYFGKLFVQLGNDGGWRERIVAAGEVIAIVNVSSAGYPSVDYRIADNLGSTAAIVNASGVLEGRYAWNMWGELVNPATYNGSDPEAEAKEALTTLGYTGHEMFWKAGLVHTKMRLYDPGTGRWLSPDPIVPNLTNGQSLNRYSYVLNNPLTLTDPYGYFAWGTFALGVGETAWAAADYIGLAAGEGLSEGLGTPLIVPALIANTDLLYNGWQNINAAFQNQGPQDSPVEAAIGKVPSMAAQGALTIAEVALAPGNGFKVVAKYLGEQLTVNGLRGAAGAANGGSGGGGAGGAGVSVSGGGLGTAFQISHVFRFYKYIWVNGPGASYIGPGGQIMEVWGNGRMTINRADGGKETINADGSVTIGLAGGTTIWNGGFAGGTVVWGLEAATRWE